jgi:hypothetical protein
MLVGDNGIFCRSKNSKTKNPVPHNQAAGIMQSVLLTPLKAKPRIRSSSNLNDYAFKKKHSL